MRNVSGLETVYRDYRDKVNFYYVYKSVEHPGINGFVSAFNLEERLHHIAKAKSRFKTEIPWICDNMDNEIQDAFGGAPNGEFILDPEGLIAVKRFWSNPKTLRADLEELVGPVEKITTVEDLPTKFELGERKIASGVVERLELPGGLVPLKINPAKSDDPFFAKLRVETSRKAARRGEGQLHLMVCLDPLYEVHWNNRAGKVHVKIEGEEGQTFSDTEMESDEVKEDADIDPRQFLIDFDLGESEDPFKVSLTYTVCDDAETFCQTLTQEYEVTRGLGYYSGSRPEIFMPAMFGKVREMDKNGDGQLTKDELPQGKITLYVGHMDYNCNEIIEKEEIDKFLAMFNHGRGFVSELNDGQQPPKQSDDGPGEKK